MVPSIHLKIKTQLVIDEAKAVDTSNYTPESVAAMNTALAAAEAVNNDANVTQEQVDQAATNLNTAIGALVIKADKSALQFVIDEAKAVDTSKYTSGSVTVLNTALAAAEAVNNDANVTQEQVDQAATNLNAAIEALVDKSKLQAFIAQASTLSSKAYSAERWKILKMALSQAITVNNNVNATQEQVDNATNKLKAAIDGLLNAYQMTFKITDQNGKPLKQASILIGGETYTATANSAVITVKLIEGEYNYTIKVNGYQDKQGSLTVPNKDKTFTIAI